MSSKFQSLPDVDQYSPQVYESIESLVEPVPPPAENPPNPDIDTSHLPTSTAIFSTFEGIDDLDSRIKQVLKDVEELQGEAGSMDLQSKIISLLSTASKPKSLVLDSSSVTSQKQLLRLRHLEARLARIETVVGVHLHDASSIASKLGPTLLSSGGTIMDALDRIETSLSLLTDESALDAALSRLNSLDLDSIQNSKYYFNLDSHNQDCKILLKLDALSTLSNLSPISNLVPHLISRLLALQHLHGETQQFSNALNSLKEESEGILAVAALLQDSHLELKRSIETTSQRLVENSMVLK